MQRAGSLDEDKGLQMRLLWSCIAGVTTFVICCTVVDAISLVSARASPFHLLLRSMARLL